MFTSMRRFSFRLGLLLLLTLAGFAQQAPVQQLPIGTLLPATLSSGINSDKSKPGQRISARLKQDVLLPDNGRVKNGSELFGHVVSTKRESGSSPATVVVVFDSLRMDGRDYPITTSLRALASSAAIYQARLPINGSAPDSVSVWQWNTRQIGGDIVFGGQQKVESLAGVVGTMPQPGWVLGVARSNPEAGCSDTGNKDLQAFWLFSTDACGAYGFEGVQVSREPADNQGGHITLTAPKRVEVGNGSGLLLMIEKQLSNSSTQ
jgi:hypothetical protein